MASGILMECLQVSGVVEYPGDVQGGDDIDYRHAALRPASAVIQRKVLLSRGSLQKPMDKIIHYAI